MESTLKGKDVRKISKQHRNEHVEKDINKLSKYLNNNRSIRVIDKVESTFVEKLEHTCERLQNTQQREDCNNLFDINDEKSKLNEKFKNHKSKWLTRMTTQPQQDN